MMQRLAVRVAASGRYILVAGIALGLAFPAQAHAMRPTVGPLVVALLFLAMLRIGSEGLRIGRRTLAGATVFAVLSQLALPMAVALPLAALDLLDRPLALGAVLVFAAAPITGAAHIVVMSRGAPAPALRQTVIGTAVLPLTVLPVLALVPAFGAASEVLVAVVRLVFVIGLAGGLALVLRKSGVVPGTAGAMAVIDAVAGVLLGLVVVGMMTAAGEALRIDPVGFFVTMGVVCGMVFGLQGVVGVVWGGRVETAGLAVALANRNVALFLGVLPAEIGDRLLLVIGCYQLPMYLTPLVLPRLLGQRLRPD